MSRTSDSVQLEQVNFGVRPMSGVAYGASEVVMCLLEEAKPADMQWVRQGCNPRPYVGILLSKACRVCLPGYNGHPSPIFAYLCCDSSCVARRHHLAHVAGPSFLYRVPSRASVIGETFWCDESLLSGFAI